jgi:hypothetical protein
MTVITRLYNRYLARLGNVGCFLPRLLFRECENKEMFSGLEHVFQIQVVHIVVTGLDFFAELIHARPRTPAVPTTTFPLFYAPMGLAGMFAGYISFMPYYVKVQEYNDAESRDLWEYELNLQPDEVRLALLSVFDLSTHRIDYYYFDDNCSLIMLAFLDVARPSLHLVEKFNSWVVPGDTVRKVFNQQGLVSQVKFRPSNVRRYLHAEDKLGEEERAAFNRLISSLKQGQLDVLPLNALSQVQKVNVVDTSLEYIDAVEQLAGTKEPEKWKNERIELLKLRSQIPLTSPYRKVPTPAFEAPHEAFPPTRISFGSLTRFGTGRSPATGLLLGWRPALHTLDNPVAGMGADLGVSFFSLEGMVYRKKLHLREFTPLGIETIPVDRPHLSSQSWSFSFSYRQLCFEGCGQIAGQYEYGNAWRLFLESSRVALRAGVKTGHSAQSGLFAEPLVSGLINFPFSNDKRWVTRAAVSRHFGLLSRPVWNFDYSSNFIFRPAESFEMDLGTRYFNSEKQLFGRMHYYF